MHGPQPPQTTPSRRLSHLLYSPLKAKRDFNLAFSFLFLLISSLVLFTMLSPVDPWSLFGFRLLSSVIVSPPERQMTSSQSCDYSTGRWVWDDDSTASSSSSVLYDENCPFLDPGFQCQRNGRKDIDYLRWRWQPDDCDLPRFDARDLLERSRDGRIVFAGDSIGRNQWESLICILSRGVPNTSSIYEENGNPISKHKGYLSMRFEDYNLTVEYYRAPFLARTGKPPLGSPDQVRMALRVDELHLFKKRWVGADVIVFNAGHWWNQDKTLKMGCYFEEGGRIDMAMNVTEAFRKSLLTWKSWVMNKFDLERSHVFFRSYAPPHFSNGKWDEGGRCNHTKPDTNYAKIWRVPEPVYNLHIGNTISNMSSNSRKVRLLNITLLTQMRKDGHPSKHREPDTPDDASEDCSHWCLPGVPDTWNQILYAHLLSDGFTKR